MRNSSIELFRIIAAFLVLIVHYNGWFAGVDFMRSDVGTGFNAVQLLLESVSVICVNCFLLISGYFSIKLNYKSIWKIWTLLVCIYVPGYLITSIPQATFTLKGLLSSVFILHQESYFVQGYLLLIILSPVLNAFIEAHKSSLFTYTALLVAIEFTWDCLFGNVSLGFGHGYQFTHFVVIYFVGRTLYSHQDQLLKHSGTLYILGFILCTGLISLLCLLKVGWAFYYSNIVVILSSVCLFIPFLKLKLHSKLINQCATAAFPVYILSVYPPLQALFIQVDQYTLTTLPFTQYLLIGAGLLVLFFLAAVAFEQIRLRIMKPIDAFMDKKVFSVLPSIIR